MSIEEDIEHINEAVARDDEGNLALVVDKLGIKSVNQLAI